MSNSIAPLPFYFRSLPNSEKILITNALKSFSYIDSYDQLRKIIHGNTDELPPQLLNELIAKSFVADETEKSSRCGALSSSIAGNIASAITSPSLFLIVPTLRDVRRDN